ncbi:MAG: hypothetical protein AB1898_18315 [Acidobacteriota bacterium]
MKKFCCLLAMLIGGLAVSALSEDKGEWTGWLTDAKCAANGAKAAHKGCALKCVESGEAIVFVSDREDKRVYKLEGSEKVKTLVGDKVVLSGTAQNDTITVSSAKKAE